MGVALVVVDAFTATPFAGNPAAVCIVSDGRSEQWMQQVAREMNLSETAFLLRGDDGFALRWFTPTTEVDLCGHATLASAHVLWESGRLNPEEEARFHTRSGLLTAKRKREWIELDFPVLPTESLDPPVGLLEALEVRALSIGKNQFDYLVEVESEEVVRGMHPNMSCLAEVATRGVIVTSRAADGQAYDFVSRFFAPRAGIDEDPVTGSAHCCLAPYWMRKLGKSELVGYQASARGGMVRVRMQGQRVVLGGQAVTVLRGELV